MIWWKLLPNHEIVSCGRDEALPQFDREFDRRVELTRVGDAEISTVFLVIDHNFTDEGPPLLFETLIFGGQHDGMMRRYATWDEAVAGHKAMVTFLQEKTE